jgi:hypothetical protein
VQTGWYRCLRFDLPASSGNRLTQALARGDAPVTHA